MIQRSRSITVGMECSDTTLRFIALKKKGEHFLPADFAEVSVPEGCLRDGKVVSRARFTRFLSDVRRKHGIRSAYVALPAGAIRIVSGLIDSSAGVTTSDAIRALFEGRTGAPLKDSVFSRRLVAHTKKGRFVQVMAASGSVAQEFLRCFLDARITPLCFEHPEQAAVASMIATGDMRSVMTVNIGQSRTTMAIVVAGSVVDTASVDQGNSGISTVGGGGYSNGLVDAINEYYIAWHNGKSSAGLFEPVTTICLFGVGAATDGYADFVSATLKLPVVTANVWGNCFSFEQHVPELNRDSSLRYAAAVGLALGEPATNLLPYGYKKRLKTKAYARRSGIVFLSFALGAFAGFVVSVALLVTKLVPEHSPLLHKIVSWW